MKNVRQIDVPTVAGNMGILGMFSPTELRSIDKDDKFCLKILSANHVPILGVLKPGVVSVHESDGNMKRFFGMNRKTANVSHFH